MTDFKEVKEKFKKKFGCRCHDGEFIEGQYSDDMLAWIETQLQQAREEGYKKRDDETRQGIVNPKTK